MTDETAFHAFDSIDTADVSSPTSASRFILGDEIARGGMGVVYRATDVTFDREVAVKVLQERFAPTSGVARRFFDEARITGQLQHPAIPPVHDVGTLPDGRPFLAMKLIKGQTLADLLADGKRPRSELVAIFEQICQAVAFAHTHGIIHRDLKPANIMVGAFGEVQVMDWGLAKELNDSVAATRSLRSEACVEPTADPGATTGHDIADESTDDRTRDGQALGTPSYMPPEQARGENDRVNQRADVFALGGILCVVLTGKPPYTGTNNLDVMKKAAAGELTEAFSRLDACGADGELVALCRQCLSADAAARPADGGEVAALVAEYRAAVEQRMRTAERERAAAEAKAIEQRKKRRVQLMLAAAVGLLLIGGGAFGWWQDRQSADRKTEQVRLEGERNAEEARRVALDNSHRIRTADVVEANLSECEIQLVADDAAKAKSALNAAIIRSNEAGAEHHQPRLARCQRELAMLSELNAIDALTWTPHDGMYPGQKQETLRWEAAFRNYGLIPGITTSESAAQAVTSSLIRERLLTALDRWHQLSPTANLRAWLQLVDRNPYRDTVRDALVAGDRQRAVRLAQEPDALNQPPRFAVILGQIPGLPHERVTAILGEARRKYPRSLALVMVLGNSYPNDQKIGAAERTRWYEAAVSLQPTNTAAWNSLSIALMNLGDRDSALAASRVAIRLDPDDPVVHMNLGNALRKAGDREGALASYREAIRLNPKYATAHNNLGLLLKANGNLDEAIAAYREAIRLNPDYVHAHASLGVALKEKGDVDGAIASYREAIRLDPSFATAQNNLGVALQDKGNLVEAIAAYREAIRLDPKFTVAHNNLGVALKDKGDLDGAIVAYREALRLDPNYGIAHSNLGLALGMKGKLDEAIVELREAVRLVPDHIPAHYNLGFALQSKDDLPGAIAAYREAIRHDPKYTNAYYNMGVALAKSGDVDAAIAAYQEAIRLNPKHNSALSNLGLLFVRKGNLDDAINCFEEALRLQPSNPSYKKNLELARKQKADRDAKIAPPPREVKR